MGHGWRCLRWARQAACELCPMRSEPPCPRRCSIRSKTMYADAVVDYQKMLLLNLPAVVVVLGVLFTTDFLSGFSVSRIISTPGAPGFLFLWAFLLPGVYVISSSLTNLVLR